MANFHLEATIISRGKGRSVTAAVGYISGKTLRDNYSGKTYYNSRNDVIWQKIFLPNDAPQEFRNLQHLCNEIECAEVRRDARTARQFIGSLPNELPRGVLMRIVHEFIALEVQGKRDREPTIHLSRIDWQKEQRGERTPAGDRKRAIKARNDERVRQREIKRECELELSR